MSPVHDATNNNNRFEENIDFAAYLKLDQFEKGSLMGGCDVEPSFAKYENVFDYQARRRRRLLAALL